MLPQTPTQERPKPTPDQFGFISVARAESFWIERSRKDPIAFIHYVTGKKPAKHHIEWILSVLTHQSTNIIAHRESGKTTILVALLAWLIAKDPIKTHFIGSVSGGQAEERLDLIREYIDTNVRFHNVFPHLHIDYRRNNNKTEFSVWSSEGGMDYAGFRTRVMMHGEPKNPTICAFGIGSSRIIGKRITGLALIDDIHSEKNSATAALRQKVDNWFNQTFLPLVTEHGRVAVICTRWAPDDQSGRLKDKKDYLGEPLWFTLETPVCDAEGNPAWPEQWSRERIQLTRDKVGPVMFELMYMNNPLGMSAGMFKLDHFRIALPSPMELSSIVVSCDLALLEKASADYSVFTAIGRTKASNYYDMFILDMFRDKISSEKLVDALIEFLQQVSMEYLIDAVLFEQQSVTLTTYNEFKGRESGFKPVLVPLKGDKGSRLFGVSLKAQRGGFYTNQDMEHHNAMVSEFMAFPKGEHDDIVDSISLPLQYWGSSERSAGLIKVQTPFSF